MHCFIYLLKSQVAIMKKKKIILLTCATLALVGITANRFSIDAIVSDNIEALSNDDEEEPVPTVEQLHNTPANYGNDWYGYHALNSGQMWEGKPKCAGEAEDCGRPVKKSCWHW